jgi:hypothetical protein
VVPAKPIEATTGTAITKTIAIAKKRRRSNQRARDKRADRAADLDHGAGERPNRRRQLQHRHQGRRP